MEESNYKALARDKALAATMCRSCVMAGKKIGAGLKVLLLSSDERLKEARAAYGAEEPHICDPIVTAGFTLTMGRFGIDVQITDTEKAQELAAKWESEKPDASTCARIEEAAYVKAALGGQA